MIICNMFKNFKWIYRGKVKLKVNNNFLCGIFYGFIENQFKPNFM